MEQQLEAPAVSADALAVSAGQTLLPEAFYDDSSSALGLGYSAVKATTRHNSMTCTDASCGRCGKTTPRQPLPLECRDCHVTWQPQEDTKEARACTSCGKPGTGQRIGNVTGDVGEPALYSRTYHPLNEYIEIDRNLDALLCEPTYRERPSRSGIQLGAPALELMKKEVERKGGGSDGRKRTDGNSPDFGWLEFKAMSGRSRYA